MMKKLIISLSLISIIAPVHGMWSGLARGFGRMSEVGCMAGAHSQIIVPSKGLRNSAFIKGLVGTDQDQKAASPVAGIAFLNSQKAIEVSRSQGVLGKVFERCLYNRDGRVMTTRSATNSFSSANPYVLGVFNAALINKSVDSFMESDHYAEWYSNHVKTHKGTKGLSEKQFYNNLKMISNAAQKHQDEVVTIVAAAAVSKSEDGKDLEEYLKGLGNDNPVTKKFTRQELEKLTDQPDQAVSYLVKRKQSDVQFLIIYDQYVGYKDQKEFPICAETSLWTIINFIFYNKDTNCFDLSLISSDITVHSDLKKFLEKYSNPQKDNYVKDAKQAWMDFISNVPMLKYCDGKNYELATDARTSLNALRYCFSIENSCSFQEMGEKLSTDQRTISLNGTNEDLQTVSVEIYDEQDYHRINWDFQQDHVALDLVLEDSDSLLTDTDIAVLDGIHKKYPELSIGSLAADDLLELLFKALEEGSMEKIIQLVELGADVNAVNDQQKSPLFVATESNNQAIVEYLLKSKSNPNVVDRLGRTPLYLAVCADNKEMVQLLLNYDADVNFFRKLEYSPFARAASYINQSMIDLLLKYKATIDQASGKKLLENAFTTDNKELVRTLLSHELDIDDFIDTCIGRGDTKKLFFMIDSGMDPKHIMKKIIAVRSFEKNYDVVIRALLGMK